MNAVENFERFLAQLPADDAVRALLPREQVDVFADDWHVSQALREQALFPMDEDVERVENAENLDALRAEVNALHSEVSELQKRRPVRVMRRDSAQRTICHLYERIERCVPPARVSTLNEALVAVAPHAFPRDGDEHTIEWGALSDRELIAIRRLLVVTWREHSSFVQK